MNTRSHIVIVEAYEGIIEFLSNEPEEQQAVRGVGLPVEEISTQLDCRITILNWDHWYRYEARKLRVPSTPATRPASTPNFDGSTTGDFTSPLVKQVPILARDPEHKLSLDEKDLSPRSHGLINDSGLLFFISYCLNQELQALYQNDPFQTVLLPMWGGVGYVAQMARATHAPNAVDVPFGVVVTDASANRQKSNEEGMWTRHAVIRRQMEDVSLALADLTLVFGARGKEAAIAGRLPEASPPVLAPRFVEPSVLRAIAQAAVTPTAIPSTAPAPNIQHQPVQFFLHEPQEPASGVLSTLDAVTLLAKQDISLDRPVVSTGPSMIFAPMKPREFIDYWSSRGFVRELGRDRQWEWQQAYPDLSGTFPVRLYPSFFEYLPNVWAELARGSLVLLSAAAAEGLAPRELLPPEILLEGEPYPETVARHLKEIAQTDVQKLDQIRRELCTKVVAAQEQARKGFLEATTTALQQLLHSPPVPQALSRVSLLFGDRRLPLRLLAEQDQPPPQPQPRSDTQAGTLSVVVTCYEMGALIQEAVESIWASKRQPDQVLLVNDGSCGEETLTQIRLLEQQASKRALPLTVISKRNEGLAAARNTGLEAATGEFISFLDGDDVVEPSFYPIALQLLSHSPRLGGVAAWASIFGTGIPDGFWNAPQAELPFLLIENSVIVPCVTRTNLLRQLGGYDVRQRYNYEDWELSIRLLASGWAIATIPANLVKYRVRSDSLYRSMTYVQNQIMRELLLATHQKVVSKFAVEIAMQIEHQLKQFVYPDESPHLARTTSTPTPKRSSLLTSTQKFLRSLKKSLRKTH